MSKKKSDDVKEQGSGEHVSTTEKMQDALGVATHDELMEQLNAAEQKANEHWERILRMQAEAENAKRRMERDVQNAHKYALEKFVNELLPIIDSLELCLTSVPDDMKKAAESVTEGVKLTLKMFYTAMEKFGIKQINPESEAFDAELHQAVSMQPNSGLESGMVVSVMQKGYSLNGRLIRPALVVVAE